jgi:hypothetical protein
MLAGNIIYDLKQKAGSGWYIDADEYQWTGKSSTLEDNPLQGGDKDHIFMAHNRRPRILTGNLLGWTREEMQEWELNFEDEETSYNFAGKYGTANDDESLFVPTWRTFMEEAIFELPPNPYWTVPDIHYFLYGPETYSLGVYGTTEKDESLVSIVFFNKSEKQIVAVSYSWEIDGDPITSLGGGDRLEPGGLL